jgi:transglutaminase-like putative cysteine protease
MSATRPWLPRRALWWGLALMLLLAAGPHLLRLPLPAALAWFLVVGWRLRLGLRQHPPPGGWTRLLLLLLASVALLAQFGTLLGREAGAALLVLLLALKFLELKTPRDLSLLVFLAYFLLSVQLLFDQSLPGALYLSVAALVITAVWVEFSDPAGGRPLGRSLRLAGVMLLQALPLMLILFLLFPRIPGPLWNLPRDAHGGVTGLSNEMEPGRISRLAQSDAVAFRVEFDGDPPPPALRYWRGPVFEHTDGRRWSPAEAPHDSGDFVPRPLDGGLTHQVTLEPHGERSLLALDRPATTLPGARLQADYQLLRTTGPVRERLRYEVTSHQRFDERDPDPARLERSRRLPAGTSARVRALAAHWRAESADPRQLIDRALRHFHEQPFVYTLNPPLLARDPVDEFLFETRRGFCEHYAAAFTILMRAAGLPARVVTGYLGGERNPVDGYLVVRQSDAHAWVEVWVAGEGWRRVDPTAAVAPERIERGIDPRSLREGEAVDFRLPADGRVLSGLERLRQYQDALNHRWNQWVLGYGPARQRELLQGLGFADLSWQGLARLLAVALVLTLGLLALLILYRPRPRPDPARRLYDRFCRKLARHGIRRRDQEGPEDFARRAAARLPRLAVDVQAISRDYIALRYGGQEDAERLERLKTRVRGLR